MEEIARLSDKDLAALVQIGNADAFVELSDRYMALVRAKAASFHSFALEADDLWQEGLLGLYHAARTYRVEGEASFRTYAGVCISNRIITAYRAQCSQKNRILNDSLSLQDEGFSDRDQLAAASGVLDPEAQVLAEERVRTVNAHLNQSLSDLEKDVLNLYLNGYAYREIAEKLSISSKGADNAIQRIRKKLRKLLD